jgi:hypothetical protein
MPYVQTNGSEEYQIDHSQFDWHILVAVASANGGKRTRCSFAAACPETRGATESQQKQKLVSV